MPLKKSPKSPVNEILHRMLTPRDPARQTSGQTLGYVASGQRHSFRRCPQPPLFRGFANQTWHVDGSTLRTPDRMTYCNTSLNAWMLMRHSSFLAWHARGVEVTPVLRVCQRRFTSGQGLTASQWLPKVCLSTGRGKQLPSLSQSQSTTPNCRPTF